MSGETAIALKGRFAFEKDTIRRKMLKKNNKQNLGIAALIVMSSMVFSRLTGFIRDALVTNLGTYNADTLNTGFAATNIMYNLLIGGAIAAALIPILSSYIMKNDEKEGWKAIGTFINVTFLASIIFCIIGCIFAPQLVSLLGQNYSPQKVNTTINITRILFPSVAFLMLAGLTNGVLYSYKRFSSAAYGPVVYNLGAIVSILVFRNSSVEKVALGIMCSSFIYFIFQLVFALKDMKFYQFKLALKNAGFIRLYKLAIPSLIASSIVQINALISQSYTSYYNGGSVTAFVNANNIWQLPYGIFAMGVGAAILPTLSEKLALGDMDSFKNIITKSLKNIFLLTVPAAVAFIVIGVPIVSAIYKWTSRFEASQITNTSNILLFFTIALFGQSILAIITRAFYALNDTRTPLYFSAGSILLNGFACYIFFKTTSLQAAGMSLAYSISSAFYATSLIYILNKKIKGLYLRDLLSFFTKTMVASIIMGIVIFILNKAIPINFKEVFTLRLKISELCVLAFEILVGGGCYCAVVYFMKIEEARYLLDITYKKIIGLKKKLLK